MTESLPTAVVGAGRMGRTHARLVHESPRAHLALVVEPDETVGRRVAEPLGARWLPSIDDALRSGEAEAFVVAVPDRLHVDLTVALLEADHHVLLEKPLADTLAGARQIVAAAEASRGRLAIGHVLRHDRRFQLAAQEVRSGGLGDPVHLRASRIVPRRVGVANGGQSPIYMYQGIHDIDLVQWVSGHRITEVCAATTRKLLPTLDADGDDAALVLLRLANDAIGVLEISWVLPDAAPSGLDASLDVYGTDGTLTVQVADQGVRLITDAGSSLPDVVLAPEIDGRLGGALAEQLDRFVGTATGGDEPAIPLEDAVAAVAVLDAIAASLEQPGWQPVPPT